MFTRDGRVEIADSQQYAARGIPNGDRRPCQRRLTRRTGFVGDVDAGDREAILYTVNETCRMRGIDPFANLWDVPLPVFPR